MEVFRKYRIWLATVAGAVALGGVFWYNWDVWHLSPHVIGVVNHAAVTDPALEGFRFGLREYGYVEGRDFRILYDGPTGSVETVEVQARRHVEDGANLLLALTTPSTTAARAATVGTDIPVLFAPSANPVEAGFVESLEHPGGRITGVTFGLQEDQRLEWLVRIVPGIKKLMYPYNPADKSPTATLEIIRVKAEELGVEIVPFETPDEASLRRLMQDIPDDISAIFVPPDALVASHTQLISSVAQSRGLPVSTPQRGGVLEGALMSYGFNLYDLGKQAAVMAGQLLHGADPASLPVVVADFELTINVRTARLLRLSIPEDILNQAFLVGG